MCIFRFFGQTKFNLEDPNKIPHFYYQVKTKERKKLLTQYAKKGAVVLRYIKSTTIRLEKKRRREN